MAVYTRVSVQDLKRFLECYDIGEPISHEGIEQGVSNTNYFLTTTSGRYVLTLYEPHRVRAEDIPFFIRYSMVLEKAGVPVPKTMLRTDTAHGYGMLCNRPASIVSVLDGEGGSLSMLTPDLCFKAGDILGRMHNAAQAGLHEYAMNHFGMNRWQHWVETLAHRMDDIAPELSDLCRGTLNDVQVRWPQDLPSGAIHADYFPDNVFFRNGLVTGVIDFHFVCTDLFAYDLAIAINAWSFDERNIFHADRMEAMMRGYETSRPLSQAERDALPVLLTAASLRFLLSRIEEKLNWTPDNFMKPHDPMVFEKRLRHFKSSYKVAA